MTDGVEVARQAAADIESWLRCYRGTVGVINVEANADFQRADIDLIWVSKRGTDTIEIKADRWHETSNFFFETMSRSCSCSAAPTATGSPRRRPRWPVPPVPFQPIVSARLRRAAPAPECQLCPWVPR